MLSVAFFRCGGHGVLPGLAGDHQRPSGQGAAGGLGAAGGGASAGAQRRQGAAAAL